MLIKNFTRNWNFTRINFNFGQIISLKSQISKRRKIVKSNKRREKKQFHSIFCDDVSPAVIASFLVSLTRFKILRNHFSYLWRRGLLASDRDIKERRSLWIKQCCLWAFRQCHLTIHSRSHIILSREDPIYFLINFAPLIIKLSGGFHYYV